MDLPPGIGCSVEVNGPSLCDQSNACFCRVEFGGSAKALRGTLVATPNASTTALNAELK